MAQLEEAIYSRLSGYAGLTALVGTRVYPNRAPQTAALPLVVYQRISTLRWSCFDADTGMARARIQTTAWAATASSAKAVKEQVRAALQRWRGTVVGVEVLDTYLADERDLFDADTQEAGMGETGAHGVALDVMIPYREA